MSFGMFNMSSLFNALMQEDERIRKEKLAALPIQLTPAKLDEKYKKKFNVSDTYVYYNITKNGEKVCDGLFSHYISDGTEKLNKERFVILNTFLEDEYSDYVIKTCNLKSKYCLTSVRCVFDTELFEIAYISDRKFDDSISVYKNICVDNKEYKVIYLPTREILFTSDKMRNLNINKVGNYLFANDCLYSDGTFMKRVNIETGEVLDVDKI